MLVAKPVGREAAAKKYDILSALASFALSQDKHKQRQVMRLMSLITSRYNWQRDELSMGQAEIARLWSVDTRTVKREMAKFKALGWLTQKRNGARGRVSVYGMDLEKIIGDTRPAWPNIGPDFVERMSGAPATLVANNIVPFRSGAGEAFGDDLWGQVCARFSESEPATYATWIAPMVSAGAENGQLNLVAPTRFHATYVMSHLNERLSHLARAVDPSVRIVDVISS